MLRTYRTCNSTVGFSKYEFYNKLLRGVILLKVISSVTWTLPYIYIYIYTHAHTHSHRVFCKLGDHPKLKVEPPLYSLMAYIHNEKTFDEYILILSTCVTIKSI